LQKAIRGDLNLDSEKKLLAVKRLSGLFAPEAPKEDHIHIVVQCPSARLWQSCGIMSVAYHNPSPKPVTSSTAS
jgi:hypothetical protein